MSTLPKVFCPSIPIEGLLNTPKMEALWRASWSSHGWEPVVLLPRSDAQAWKDLQSLVSPMKSHNRAVYRNQCMTRWVDFGLAGGGLMVDMDMINLGWTPEHLARVPMGDLVIRNLTPDLCPCGVVANRQSAMRFVRYMMDWSERIERRRGTLDSDQDVFVHMGGVHPSRTESIKVARHYLCDGWETSKLLHFPNRVIEYRGKADRCKASAIMGLLERHGLSTAAGVDGLDLASM